MKLKLTFLLIFASIFFGNIYGHAPNHSYVFLKIYESHIEGRIEFAAAEINLELNQNLNVELVESEVFAIAPMLKDYFRTVLKFKSANKVYPVDFTTIEIFPLDDEPDNIILYFKLKDVDEIPENLSIEYSPFFEKNSDHKGILIVEHNWKSGIINNHLQVSDIFTDGDTVTELSLSEDNIWKGFVAMIKLGMWHIWIGLDHILFLVALILPAVVRRKKEGDDLSDNSISIGSWIPVPKFKPAFLYLLGIVTSFTIAHSITLAIAAFGIVDLPSRYVESIIALSIALAALHNIWPLFKLKEWIIAFAFGLFHGFGFASVLGEKGLAGEFVSYSLLGFNVGVEIGQLLIVSAIFPILYLLRNLKIYPKIIFYGSILLIIISLQWVIERFFEFNIPLGRFLDSFL